MTGEVHGEGGGSPGGRFWEERYRTSTRPSNGSPSGALVGFAEPLPGGTALDPGCSRETMLSGWLTAGGGLPSVVVVAAAVLARAAKNAQTAGVLKLIESQRYDLASTFRRPVRSTLRPVLAFAGRVPAYAGVAGRSAGRAWRGPWPPAVCC